MNVSWTERSRRDLALIHDFIARDSVSTATRYIEKIVRTVSILESSPRAGRIVPELNQDLIRELVLENYRLVYAIHKDQIYILTVFERHRLPDVSSLSDFEE